ASGLWALLDAYVLVLANEPAVFEMEQRFDVEQPAEEGLAFGQAAAFGEVIQIVHSKEVADAFHITFSFFEELLLRSPLFQIAVCALDDEAEPVARRLRINDRDVCIGMFLKNRVPCNDSTLPCAGKFA